MNKNEFYTARVTGMTSDGAGVCRVCATGETGPGTPVFVPGAAVGDVLRLRIVRPAKGYAFGRLEELLSPGPGRQTPDCPVFRPCGGCAYRHVDYATELLYKQQKVADALRRIGGLDVQVHPIVGAAFPDRYRNKALLPVGRGPDGRAAVGFFARHSHRMVPCKSCLLQPRAFDDIAAAFCEYVDQNGVSIYDETTHTGLVRHLYLRAGESSGEILVCAVLNGDALPNEAAWVEAARRAAPGVCGVLVNANTRRTNVVLGPRYRTLWGKPTVTDTLCSLRFELSPQAFYQVNRAQAERLYTLAGRCARLTGEETLLDLYCGTGTVGLSMAKSVRRLIGVEIVPEAVENARENARRNGVQNATFYAMDAAEAAALLQSHGERPDVVVMDPPRKGCEEALLHTVAAMAPARIVYISCEPATLARDLARLQTLGYAVEEVTPVDMFPRTASVEAVCLLSKRGGVQPDEARRE